MYDYVSIEPKILSMVCLKQCLWFNEKLHIKKSSGFVWKKWYRCEIPFISDTEEYLSHNEFIDLYNIHCSFFDYMFVRMAKPFDYLLTY